MSFSTLGLCQPLLDAISTQGYTKPSPIQEHAIPPILQGRDVMAAAQTGTGKTAAFTLPMLELLNSKKSKVSANRVRALVLTPTRELAAQVGDSVANYGAQLQLSSAIVFGGVNINPQMMKLRKGVDVLVATPGRLLDLQTKNAVKLDQVELFVLDEADRMLDMGFIRDIKKVIECLPKRRQNLLFSATFSDDIRALAKGLIHDPVEVSVAPANTTAKTVEQQIVVVDKPNKTKALIKLIKDGNWFQVLVFSRTKHGANKIALQLNKAGIKASPIHGNKSQGARTRALAEFKNGDIQVLVATDIAARGLDIDQLPQVVNYDLPHVSEDYVHRIGRTGRAGSSGKAISLVCAAEQKELFGIERLIQEVIPRIQVAGFEAKEKLAESPTTFKPIKAKKPKKNRPQGKQGSERDDSVSANKHANKQRRTGSSVSKPKEQVNKEIWGAKNNDSADSQSPKQSPRRHKKPSNSKGGQSRAKTPNNENQASPRTPRKRSVRH